MRRLKSFVKLHFQDWHVDHSPLQGSVDGTGVRY